MSTNNAKPRGGNRGASESNSAGRPDSRKKHTPSISENRKPLRGRAGAREPLTGCRCECPTCLERFGSVRGFDRHRTGSFARPGTFPHDRRCYSASELRDEGWTLTERGFWLTPDRRRAFGVKS